MPRFFLVHAAKGRRVVVWTVLCFAASQLALWTYLDRRHPEVRDGLYHIRLRSLQARQAESPNAPLVLFLGSSRVKHGLGPAAMNVRSGEGAPPPAIYNFGINGMGSIRELMYLRRLLADGVRPDWLIVETYPPLWAEDGFFRESRMVSSEDDLSWRDLALVCRYFFHEPFVVRLAFRKSLVPLFEYRARLVQAATPPLVPRGQIGEWAKHLGDWTPADGSGWSPAPWEPATDEVKRRVLKNGLEELKPLVDPVRIDPRSDAALRELLEECRRRGIKVALMIMPEPSVTRGWYPPPARALIRAYLGRFHREYQVPIIDTRDWVADEDFVDTCHMGARGVAPFSARVGREVVQPLLEGKPLSAGVLLAEEAASAP